MTTLLEPNRDASTGYSPLIRVFGWPGTLYKVQGACPDGDGHHIERKYPESI